MQGQLADAVITHAQGRVARWESAVGIRDRVARGPVESVTFGCETDFVLL